MTPSDPPRTVGAGRYLLRSQLGRGSAASVFRGWDLERDVACAVKLLHDSYKPHARFDAEATTMASLDHENILAVSDRGIEDGRPWYVTDFAPGGTLSEYVRSGEHAESERIRRVIEVLSAIEFAHLSDIIHRDIKPSNVLISGTGRALLADFGIAHYGSGRVSYQTRTGSRLGTAGYASPEQRINAKNVTNASDIFGMGATLYFALTARLPVYLFATETYPDVLRGLSDTSAAVIVRACRHKPQDRYGSAREMAAEVRRLLHAL